MNQGWTFYKHPTCGYHLKGQPIVMSDKCCVWSKLETVVKIKGPYYCGECGGMVDKKLPHTNENYTMRIGTQIVSIPYPDDLLIDTCNNCNDFYMTENDEKEILQVLRERWYKTRLDSILEL